VIKLISFFILGEFFLLTVLVSFGIQLATRSSKKTKMVRFVKENFLMFTLVISRT
jgi:hypothetical protein